MATLPNPDPTPVPDDELDLASHDPWWAPIATALLDELDAPPAYDDSGDPADSTRRPSP